MFSLELVIKLISLGSKSGTVILWFNISGSYPLCRFVASKNLLPLPALSKKAIVLPSDIGEVLVLKL